MDNQHQSTIHIQGHESHSCHKCGWPFPNPHPSAKHRRAHRKICGTIPGYKLFVSEHEILSNASDGEQFSDDDRYTLGSIPLDTGNNKKVNGEMGENLTRSGDEVFLDAIANFSDGAPSPGAKEALPYSLDSATDVEIVNIKYPEFSGSHEDNHFNATDVSQLSIKSRDHGQAHDPNILQSERIEDGNMLELQGQLSGFPLDPLSSSITDLRTVAHNDDYFGLSSDSNPSKAKVTPEMLLENKICAGKNVRDNCLTTYAKETSLKENDEIESDGDMVEIVVSSDNTVGDTHEGKPKIPVSDVVNLDSQVAGEAFNLKEKNNDKFLSVIPQNEFPIEVNSSISTNTSTNGVQVEFAHMMQFATSGDVKVLQEREEGNVNVFTRPSCGDRPDVAHPQDEYADFKDHKGVLPQNSLSLRSYEAWKPKRDDLKDSSAEENDFLINQSQLTEKREVPPPDGPVLNSRMKEQDTYELVPEEMHAKESIEVSFVKFMIESDKRSDETGASMNAMKTEMNESNMIHFSEERESNDVCKNSQQISLPEGSFMVASKENPSDTSFGGSTIGTFNVISIDNVSHDEKYVKELNDIAVDGKCRRAKVENDSGISMNTIQFSNLQLKVKTTSGAFKSDDAVEIDKFKKGDITDAQYMESSNAKYSSLPKPTGSDFQCPILSEVVMDRSARTQDIGCTNRGPLSEAQEDIKYEEINSNCRVHEECNRFFSTSTDSHHTQDAELLVKAAEDLGRNHQSLSSLNGEPSAQCVSVVQDPQEGERGREVSGIKAMPVQDQNGNNEVQLPSVDSGIRCDSLEGNWVSVSVSEARKSNLKDPKAESEGPQFENSEMFEPPSFMTLVEPGHGIGPKAAASEVQKGLDQQCPNSTSIQAGWFPALTQVINESEGRKRNEKIIAKITNSRTSKQHTPPESPLGEVAYGNKPKSPNLEENSVIKKNGALGDVAYGNKPKSPNLEENSVIQKNGASPATKSVKGEGKKVWSSPTRYPADTKKQNKKVKSRPSWMQFVCCSSVDSPRR